MNPVKVFYYGEFGPLNFCILGAVEVYLAARPDARFALATFRDYFVLFDQMYPGVFTHVEYAPAQAGRHARVRHSLLGVPLPDGFTPLVSILRSVIKLPPRSPIVVPSKRLSMDTGPHVRRPVISICTRQRRFFRHRNLTAVQWRSVLATLRKEYPDGTLVFHGLPEETLDFHDLPGSRRAASILESIYYLNRSRFLVSSISGFAQFAGNCGCNTIQIGPRKPFFKYQPFRTTDSHVPPGAIGTRYLARALRP